MPQQFFKFNGRFGRHNTIKHPLVLFLQLSVSFISLILLDRSHIERRPLKVSACGNKIVTRRMENFCQLFLVGLARLFLVRASSVYNLFDFVEKDPVFPFNFSGSILLNLDGFCVRNCLQVIPFKSVHGSISVLKHFSMLCVFLIVVDTI